MSMSVLREMEGLTFRTMDGPKLDEKFRIAIDFGTTHSAIAWTHYIGDDSNQRQPDIVDTWPGKAGDEPKVPTTLKYKDGNKKDYRWGFLVGNNEKRHEWFKLGLDPGAVGQSKLASRYPSNTALPPVYGEDCEKIVVDYLTALRKHTDTYLTDLFGVGDKFLGTTAKEYIITVPAMWSHKAQNITKLCAKEAGMGNIQIVSEPEAAGMYAMNSMVGLGLKEKDTFVICDAGGGTVDLITYTVDSLYPTMSLKEVVPGEGRLCGSIFLNRIFAEYLEEKFKNVRKWDEACQTEAMGLFERHIKRDFEHNPDFDTYIIPARGFGTNLALDIVDNKLILSRETMQKIFEPVIKEIIELVQTQIRKALKRVKSVKAVLLAGGFGQNTYLRLMIKAAVDRIERGISVRTIKNSNTAIVRGALMTPVVKSRKARKHYGATCFTKFEEEEGHDISKREENPLTGDYEINMFDWFIRKDDELKDGETYQCGEDGFYFEKRVDHFRRGFRIPVTIYTCEDPNSHGPPKYFKGARGVKELVTLKADLSTIDTRNLPTAPGTNGNSYYKVDFDIEMGVNSASMTFVLVRHEGNRRVPYPKTIVEEFI